MALLAVLSLAGYFATLRLIPIVAVFCRDKGDLFGRDINKVISDKIPESLGIVVGVVYLTVVIMFQPFFLEKLGDYNAAMTSICFMLLLGFIDDVLDVRWSVKICLSFLATLPLLVAYSGPTNIIVPKPFRGFVGQDVQLGYLYHVYMAFIAVFCTNSINIYAGINGLEATQTAIIAGAILVHNYLELGGLYTEQHELSMFLTLPFFACTLALIFYNWYPSEVFVGDSFTYLAGMSLAVPGILGHFSKTLMLFFLPQLINFTISIPQLIGIVPCPRHRTPKFNPETNKLEPTYNFTIINLYLYLFGPTHEGALTFRLAILQILCCALGFAIRYSHSFTPIFYDQ
jgi:UDP-N-acetylglucosamine--dolichyl-phosphate N-acetylglucosaminephosphotransferase